MKIIRLTESDLARLVNRVIKEQSKQTVVQTQSNHVMVDKIFNKISRAMSGPGTDEDAILNALYELAPNGSGAGWDANVAQKRKDYEYLLELLRKKGFKKLVDWLKTDLTDRGSKPDPLGLTKPWQIDRKILNYATSLEDLLSGRKDYM